MKIFGRRAEVLHDLFRENDWNLLRHLKVTFTRANESATILLCVPEKFLVTKLVTYFELKKLKVKSRNYL